MIRMFRTETLVINHWDKAITYAAPCCLIVAFSCHVPG